MEKNGYNAQNVSDGRNNTHARTHTLCDGLIFFNMYLQHAPLPAVKLHAYRIHLKIGLVLTYKLMFYLRGSAARL
jgi:hypothetical protein